MELGALPVGAVLEGMLLDENGKATNRDQCDRRDGRTWDQEVASLREDGGRPEALVDTSQTYFFVHGFDPFVGSSIPIFPRNAF